MKLKSPNLRDDLTPNIVIKSLISSQLSCLPHHQGSSTQGSKMAAAVLSTHHGSRREGRKISFPRIPQQTPPGSMALIGPPTILSCAQRIQCQLYALWNQGSLTSPNSRIIGGIKATVASKESRECVEDRSSQPCS